MNWNGSYLGKINLRKCTLNKKTIKLFQYRKLRLNNTKFWCIIHTSKNALPCIIDEIKFLFGLKKLGTHSLKYGKTKYIIYRIRRNPEKRLKDHKNYEKIKSNQKYENLRLEISKIVLFRYITNCNINCNSIIIRADHAFSFITKINNDNEYNFNEMFDRWVNDIDITLELLINYNERDIEIILNKKILKIVERIDKKLILYKNIFIEKIISLK